MSRATPEQALTQSAVHAGSGRRHGGTLWPPASSGTRLPVARPRRPPAGRGAAASAMCPAAGDGKPGHPVARQAAPVGDRAVVGWVFASESSSHVHATKTRAPGRCRGPENARWQYPHHRDRPPTHGQAARRPRAASRAAPGQCAVTNTQLASIIGPGSATPSRGRPGAARRLTPGRPHSAAAPACYDWGLGTAFKFGPGRCALIVCRTHLTTQDCKVFVVPWSA
jgi:hypothetical protein